MNTTETRAKLKMILDKKPLLFEPAGIYLAEYLQEALGKVERLRTQSEWHDGTERPQDGEWVLLLVCGKAANAIVFRFCDSHIGPHDWWRYIEPLPAALAANGGGE